ncbi:degenerin del-1-like [Aplysia californica]|uniref:Degenerin del-1-like n=1 Tax=Aplysia californica TaxID=6500 RepID=A0ABM1A7S9_APLCA|nr:degenerin del-1-like [Aplysia californica]
MGLFQEFSESTSMHGLQRAVSSESKWKRPLWAALVLTGACLATFNLSQTLKDFLHNPTTTQTKVYYNPKMEFPVVTLCNLNPFPVTNLVAEMDFMTMSNFWEANNFKLEDVMESIVQFQKSQNVPITFKLGDLVTDCQFDMVPCRADDFLTVFNYKYGDCFVFNKQIKEDSNQEYMHSSEAAGFKVVVHSQDTIAFPENQGFMVMPGASTSVGLKRTEMSRAPPPYSTCIELEDEYNIDLNVFSFTDGTRYTGEACRKTCYIREVVSQCGCCDLYFVCPPEVYNVYVVNETIPYCNATNIDDFFCKKRVLEAFEKGELDCLSRCLPPCDEVVYDVALSTALWPSDSSIYFDMESNDGSDIAISEFEEFKSHARDNFLRVAIFYEDLTVQRVESRPSYDWNRLLSDIGGQLGLWLGFSILTAAEWLELAYDAGIRAATRKAQGAHTTKVHVQEEGK